MGDFTTLKCAGSDNSQGTVYFDASNNTLVPPVVSTATSGSIQTDGTISAERTVSKGGRHPYTMILDENGGVRDTGQDVAKMYGNPPTSSQEKEAFKQDAKKYAKACATAVGPAGPS